MKMMHRLSGVRSIIGEDPITRLEESFLFRDAHGHRQEMLGQRRLRRHHVAHCGIMSPRHDQHMSRRLRTQIAKRDGMLAFDDKLRAKFAARDATKDTIGR